MVAGGRGRQGSSVTPAWVMGLEGRGDVGREDRSSPLCLCPCRQQKAAETEEGTVQIQEGEGSPSLCVWGGGGSGYL